MKLLKISKLICIILFLVNFFTIRVAGQQANFTNLVVSGGWNEIEGFVWDSTGQQYVWEKGGRVWVVDTNGTKLLVPLINLSEEVGNWRDHGLNGFALDPGFRTNGFIYLYYTVDRHHLLNFGTPAYNPATNTYFQATIARVTRYQCDSTTNFTTLVPGSRMVIVGEDKKTGIPVLHESHSGGTLVFGTDGSLLISTGDGASYNFVDSGGGGTYWNQALIDTIILPNQNVGAFRAQLIDSHNGKILRVDPANGDGLESNPYFDTTNARSAKSRVWALGLRNPFRMTFKRGSGETDITAGNPGALYIGDVGWNNWEELNINFQPGQNFGWPLYEGLTPHIGYQAKSTLNYYSPNPLSGIGNCAMQYFRFKDLLNQATLDPDPFFENPCDSLTEIPDSVNTFLHTRPVIDWKHGTQTRTGIFNGLVAAEININDSLSPVTGNMFGGYASIGGLWYDDDRFPVKWQNTYFHADYVGQWIRNFVIDTLHNPSEVRGFWDNNGIIVFLAVNPRNGCISYANYPDQIKEICYGGVVNNLPAIVLSVDTTYGSSPFQVQFTGSLSSDPENQPLQYKWKFGDGDSSSLADPIHVYNPAGNQPVSYYAVLTITDDIGQTAKDSVLISVNNTPPQAAITSFNDGDLYSMNGFTNLPLQAFVTDAEHGPNELSYEWITVLHHNFHTHIEEIDTNKITTTVISPIGCEAQNDYHFSIRLRVTDAAGLFTEVESAIYPSCLPPVAAFSSSDSVICAKSSVQFNNLSTNFPMQWQWSFPGGTPSTSTSSDPLVVYNIPGTYQVQLIASGMMGSDTIIQNAFIQVKPLPTVAISSSNGTQGFCPEESYSLTANTSNNIVSWEWTRYSVPIGSNSPVLALTKGGNYKVTVTNIWGCTRLSKKYLVTKYAPATISVTASGPLSFCPGDSVTFTAVTNYPTNTFSWKNYSNIIPGATSDTYTAHTSGKYKAIATTLNNCVRASSAFIVDVSCRNSDDGTTEFTDREKFILSPNPTQGKTTIYMYQDTPGPCSLIIADVTGRIVVVFEDSWFEPGFHQVNFDTENFVPGIYQAVLNQNGQTRTASFVKSDGY